MLGRKHLLASATISLIMVSGCAGVKYEAAEAFTLKDGQQQQIEILGAGEWRDTGILVSASETYALTSTGTWSMGAICGPTDASGAGVGPLCAGDPWGLGATGSTLIGRIGSKGKPFRVGDNFTLKPKTEGKLHLRSYDLIPFDNTGSVNVTILKQGAIVAAAPAATAPVEPPAPVVQTVSNVEASGFSSDPMAITFIQGPSRPDDVAVIIGNADYKKQGKDIPNIQPAYSDAATFKRYACVT